jgi:hypothetical protein
MCKKIKDTYFNIEDGSSTFFRKFSIHLKDDATTQTIIA